MMRPILAIAHNTFRQTVRQRLFLNVAVFGVGMLLFAMVVGQITFGHPHRVVRSIGLSGVTLAVDLLALLVAVSLIHQEIDRRTLFVVLTRPIRRYQYVAGRFLGLLATIMVALLGFSVIFLVVLVTTTNRGHFSMSDGAALIAVLPEAAIIGSFGLVLSAFSTPTLSAGIGLGFWIAAATTDDLLKLTEKANESTQLLAKIIYYTLPGLERFNFREFAIYQQSVQIGDLAATLLYGGMYTLGLVALASAILSRREMI